MEPFQNPIKNGRNRVKIDTLNLHIYNLSLPWLGTGTIKSGNVKLIEWAYPSPLSEILMSCGSLLSYMVVINYNFIFCFLG